MPIIYRQALTLRVKGYSIKEISEMTKTSEATVKSRIHRARKLLLESFDEPDLSEVPELSDDLGGLLVIVDVFGEFSEEDCLCLAVIMPQITKMIITQYMNIMRICLLEKRDILIPRIMLSINISLYILKNY